MTDERPWCSVPIVPRYDPNNPVRCGNHARWRAADGVVRVCGRHLRYAPRPLTELPR